MRLSTEVAQFIMAHDVVLLAGSTSAAGVPTGILVAIARVEDGGEVLSFAVPSKVVPRFLEDLAGNPQVALSATRFPDCTSFQVKGRVLDVRPTGPDDDEAIARYLAGLTKLLWTYNPLARENRSIPRIPADHRVRIAVTSVFLQTPGPAAGAPVPS